MTGDSASNVFRSMGAENTNDAGMPGPSSPAGSNRIGVFSAGTETMTIVVNITPDVPGGVRIVLPITHMTDARDGTMERGIGRIITAVRPETKGLGISRSITNGRTADATEVTLTNVANADIDAKIPAGVIPTMYLLGVDKLLVAFFFLIIEKMRVT